MLRRSVTCWLALAASLVMAVLPPAVVARSVCTATGRVAVAWGQPGTCALATVAEPPCCCDHDREPAAAPARDRGDDPVPGEVPDGDDGCCATSPAFAPVAQPDVDRPDLDRSLPTFGACAAPLATVTTAARGGAPIDRATGPPGHALRRHLGARRAVVLTI